jgi:hypothetical protein
MITSLGLLPPDRHPGWRPYVWLIPDNRNYTG